jgi:hypothetical protein
MPAARHYAELVVTHSEAGVISACKKVLKTESGLGLARQFHLELARAKGSGATSLHVKLLAIRVERRTIAAAIFDGDRLDYTDVRHLSSNREKALGSCIGFINWLLEQFPLETVALETIPETDLQRKAFGSAVIQVVRDRGLPLWEVSKNELFLAYGHPALHSRRELREVIRGIWPVLAGSNGKSFIQDAVALGQYVQIERQFIN